MPAQSQQQQKLFGLALAFKRGEVPASEVSDEIKDIADRMSEKEIEDFASTKHKGLPKMKEQLRKIVREIMREKVISEISEGKKRFRQQDGVGKAKYTISYHDGKQKHKDGSDFFGIQIFKNKKDLETFRNALLKKGFVEESVNEGIEPQIKKIAYFTGTRPEAVEDFVSKYALNFTKLLKYVEKGGLPQRMEFVAALAGRPNNPKQKKIIKQFQESVNENNISNLMKIMQNKYDRQGYSLKQLHDEVINYLGKKDGGLVFQQFIKKNKSNKKVQDEFNKTSFSESVNEGYSTEEKRIVMMAVRKLAKYRNVPLDYAINDLLGAGQELERDIKKGKIK